MVAYTVQVADAQDAALQALMMHENEIRAAINITLQARRDAGEKDVPENWPPWTPETYLQALADPILEALRAERQEAETQDIVTALSAATDKDLEIVRGVLGLNTDVAVKARG